MKPSTEHGENRNRQSAIGYVWVSEKDWIDSDLSMMHAMLINSSMEMQIVLQPIYWASKQADWCRLHMVQITQISFQTKVHTFNIVVSDIVGPVTKPELTIALLSKNDKAHNGTTLQKWYPSHTRKQSRSSIVLSALTWNRKVNKWINIDPTGTTS